MKLILILCLVITLCHSRTYPLYKQCDPRWGNQLIGSSNTTLCRNGSPTTTVSMALSGTGHQSTPSTLNTWLKSNSGYVSDTLIWGSISKLGLSFRGRFSNSQIKPYLDQQAVVICNVRNQTHWVLATNYSGDTIYVNDPLYSQAMYQVGEVADGNSVVYLVQQKKGKKGGGGRRWINDQ